MDKETRPIYMLPPRDPSQIKRYTQTKVKHWKKIFHNIGKEKKAGVVVLMSDKVDFTIKAIVRDKQGHYQGCPTHGPRAAYSPGWLRMWSHTKS